MHIDNSLRLDFKDVLIRPKRSTLNSRSDVDITRDFRFLHSPHSYHGVPIIAANMDTTGTFEMAKALDPLLLSTALDKHYSEDELIGFFSGLRRKSAAFYTMGIGSEEFPDLMTLNTFKTKFSKEVRHVSPDRDLPVRATFYKSLLAGKKILNKVRG